LSNRGDALTVLVARLAEITAANGYSSDAGLKLFIGEQPVMGPSDPEASIAVVVRPDEPGYQGENVDIILPVGLQAIVKSTAGAWVTIENTIADIKRAVETDHDLGGTLKPRGLVRGVTRPLDRESGSEYVGAEVEYRLNYGERWGQP